MFTFIFRATITLFIFSLAGYVLVVLKEKYFLRNNIIVLDNKYLTQEDLSETDIYEFILKGQRLKSGDVIQVLTSKREKVNGVIIGAKKSDDTIHIITTDNNVFRFKIENILKFKVISKYGRFFKD